MAETENVELRLAELPDAVGWPPTPDLWPAVRAGIARRRRRRLLLLLVAAAIGLALAGGAAAAASVGLRGALVQRVPRLPSPSPVAPGPAGSRLVLGDRYASLSAAEAAAGFPALAPASLGPPDEVYYSSDSGVLTLLYLPRPGLPATEDPDVGALVMEARASVDGASFVKLVGPGTRVQPVTVNGGPGFWISGAPHGFFFYGPRGSPDHFRLTGDVLIWNQAGLVIRIESGLDERAALAAAGTTRRPPV